jgi:hypothetical protein
LRQQLVKITVPSIQLLFTSVPIATKILGVAMGCRLTTFARIRWKG